MRSRTVIVGAAALLLLLVAGAIFFSSFSPSSSTSISEESPSQHQYNTIDDSGLAVSPEPTQATSTTTTLPRTPAPRRRVRSQPSIAFITSLQSDLAHWNQRCLDAKNKKNPLAWSSSCRGSFENLLASSQDDRVFETLSRAVFEAHGDSTLRELVKYLVPRLGVREGSLEKKDANTTMRQPRFFARDAPLRREQRNVSLHVAFRFDFWGQHFAEPLEFPERRPNAVATESIPSSSSSTNKRDLFLFASVGSHIAKETVTHGGKRSDKQLVVSAEEKVLWRCVIRRSIVLPLHELLVDKFLPPHIRVVHGTKSSSSSPEAVIAQCREGLDEPVFSILRRRNSTPSSRQNNIWTDAENPYLGAVSSPALVVFMMQALECAAMADFGMMNPSSKKSGFSKLAPFCPIMQIFLEVAHEMIIKQVADVVQGRSVAEMKKRLVESGVCPVVGLEKGGKRRSSAPSPLCALVAEADADVLLSRLQGRFVYVGPSGCKRSGGGRTDRGKKGAAEGDAAFLAAAGNGKFCSRDGIHFRARFVRARVDLALNLMSRWMGEVWE